MLLAVAFLLRLLVGLVGLRVDAPHALGPLPIDHTALLLTGEGERQEKQSEGGRGMR